MGFVVISTLLFGILRLILDLLTLGDYEGAASYLLKALAKGVSIRKHLVSRFIWACIWGFSLSLIIIASVSCFYANCNEGIVTNSTEIYGVSYSSSIDKDNANVLRYITKTEKGLSVNEIPASSAYVKIGDYEPVIINYYKATECTWNPLWHFHSYCEHSQPIYLHSEIFVPENYTSEYDWMLE